MEAVISHIILRFYAPSAPEQEHLAAAIAPFQELKSAYFDTLQDEVTLLAHAPIDIGGYPFETDGDVTVLADKQTPVFMYGSLLCTEKLHENATTLPSSHPAFKLYNEQFVNAVVISAVLPKDNVGALIMFTDSVLETLTLSGNELLSVEVMSDEGGVSCDMLNIEQRAARFSVPASRFAPSSSLIIGDESGCHYDMVIDGINGVMRNALPAYPADMVDGRTGEEFPALSGEGETYSLGTIHTLSTSSETFCGQITDSQCHPILRIEQNEASHYEISRIVMLPKIDTVDALLNISCEYPEVSAFGVVNGSAINMLAALSTIDSLVGLVAAGVDVEFSHNDQSQRVFKMVVDDELDGFTPLFEGTESQFSRYLNEVAAMPESLLSEEMLLMKAMELNCAPADTTPTKKHTLQS
jgi:hypothetical protein